jgi:hypothetical protein
MRGNVDPIEDRTDHLRRGGRGLDWALGSAAMKEGDVDPIGIEPTTSAMPWRFGACL